MHGAFSSCYHCKFCHTCFAGYTIYIEHFRVGGKLNFKTCPNKEKRDG